MWWFTRFHPPPGQCSTFQTQDAILRGMDLPPREQSLEQGAGWGADEGRFGFGDRAIARLFRAALQRWCRCQRRYAQVRPEIEGISTNVGIRTIGFSSFS